MARYKNISPSALVIPQVGKFEPGEEFETEREIINAHIQAVTASVMPPVAPANSSASETHVAQETTPAVAEPATAASAEGGTK